MPPGPKRHTGWLRAIRAFLILSLTLDLLFLPLTLLHIQGITVASAPLDAVLDIRNYPIHRKFADLSVFMATIYPQERPTYLQWLLYSCQQGLAYTLATIPMLFYAIRVTGEAIRND